MIARLDDTVPSSVFEESHIHNSIPQSSSCCLSGTVNPVIIVAVQLMTHFIGIQKQYITENSYGEPCNVFFFWTVGLRMSVHYRIWC